MEQKNLDKALEIFSALMTGEEVGENGKNAKLFEAYHENSEVGEILENMLKKMNMKVFEHEYTLYVTPGDKNRVFGYTNEELKREMGVRLNRELYLCYFIMFRIVSFFYPDTATYTYTENIKITQILESTDAALKKLISGVDLFAKDDVEEHSFERLALTWDELPVVSNEDMSQLRAGRSSKTGYIKLVLNFMQSQKLIIEAEERYYPTKRLHALIRNYYEDETNRLYELAEMTDTERSAEEAEWRE